MTEFIHQLQILFAAILSAVYFIEMARMHKALRIDFKPFNCLMCLSTWLALAFQFVPSFALTYIIVSCLAGAMVNPIKNFIQNINFTK
jgi:hypothetical protein